MREDWEELQQRQSASFEGVGRFVAWGVVAMLAFLAWTQFSGEKTAAVVPPTDEASVVPSADIELPRVVGPPVSHYQGPPASSDRESYVGVYECVVNGQRVVSDRPCAPDAQTRTLVIDQPDPRNAARQRQLTQASGRSGSGYTASPPAAPVASRSGGMPEVSNEAACASVDRAIEQLNARMRQPYSSAEGEWLRARWRELKRRRYDLRCGR